MENLEIWKDIPTYEGLYKVSNKGNILNVIRNKKLSLCPGTNGYLRVTLCNNGKKYYRVHQLVGMAFLCHNINDKKYIIDHKNNVKDDNNVDNLQIITQRENTSKDRKNKTSKYTGVCYHKKGKKFRASITINKKNKHLGFFENEYDAHLKYQEYLNKIDNE